MSYVKNHIGFGFSKNVTSVHERLCRRACGDSRLRPAAVHGYSRNEIYRFESRAAPRTEVTKLTTISAIPAPSSSRCGPRNASQTMSGGHKTLASRKASRQASTPERNPTAVATRRFFSGVIQSDSKSCLWGQPPSAVRRAKLDEASQMYLSYVRRTPKAAVPTFKN
jgi:hypothetical protein